VESVEVPPFMVIHYINAYEERGEDDGPAGCRGHRRLLRSLRRSRHHRDACPPQAEIVQVPGRAA